MSEVKVILEKLKAGDKAIIEEYPKNIGKRTKLGGSPLWIQNDETPICKTCKAKKTFVAQIDSFDYIDKYIPGVTKYGAEEYMFGDVGMIYVFFCFDCLEPSIVFQCY